jgi:hypothetical protein
MKSSFRQPIATLALSIAVLGSLLACAGQSLGDSAPTIISLSPDKTSCDLGETVAIQFRANDPDGDLLSYAWTCSAGSFTGATDAAAMTWTAPENNIEATITLKVTAKGKSTESSTKISVSFTAQVSDMAAVGGSGQVLLSWTLPTNSRYDGVDIFRKAGSLPSGRDDPGAVSAYHGASASFVDSGLANGTTYYYSAYAYAKSGDYSALYQTAQATTASSGGTPGGTTGTSKPNLKPTLLSLPAAIYDTSTADFTVTVKNDSSVAVSSPFNVGLYLRTDSTSVYYSTNKIGSATVPGIGANESLVVSVSGAIPASALTAAGTAYIGAWLDNGELISESDENDNRGGYAAATSSYSVGDCLKSATIHENKPDIAFDGPINFSASYLQGQESSVVVDIVNKGPAAIPGLFKVGIYLRKDSSSVYTGTQIGSAIVAGLASGERKTVGVPIVIPTAQAYSVNGTYIGAWLDCDNAIGEISTEYKGDGDMNKGGWNGSAFIANDQLKLITIQENLPNLELLAFAPATSYARGSSANISVTFKNSGHRATETAFKVGIYLRPTSDQTTTIYYSNFLIGEKEVTDSVAAEGGSKDLIVPIVIPSSPSLANAYIGVWLDSGNTVVEQTAENLHGEGDWNKGGWNGTTYSTSTPGLKAIAITAPR